MTHEPLPATAARPITSPPRPGRIPSLDVIRGLAIIGTLASNIWLFVAFSGDRIIDIGWHDFLDWVPDGKFLGLLTLMFGVGIEIQRQAARRRGSRWPGTYLVRAALLFVDGVLNYILVIQFDVLRSYAIAGFLVAFVLLLPERHQWKFIAGALSVHLGLLVLDVVAPQIQDGVPNIVLFGDIPIFEQRPTYAQTVESNLHTFLTDLTPGSDAGTIVTLALVLFPVGAILYRRGLFAPERRRLRLCLVAAGFGIGLPVDILSFVGVVDHVFGRYAAAPLVAIGILALMAEFYQRRPIGWVGRRLRTVGAMALSCYVLQNALGRALQSILGPSALSPLVDPVIGTLAMFVVITVLMVAFAELWLRLFRKGPLELVWDRCFRLLTRVRRG